MQVDAMNPLDTKLCRVSEVAKALALSRSMVYGLMDKGELPYVKIGKARRVPADAVDRFVREQTVSK